MELTGLAAPIGRERVDRAFAVDYDSSNPQLMLGAADPKSSRAFWSYRLNGSASAAGLFDRLIGYDAALDRWVPPINVGGEFLSSVAQPGVTLENLDSISGSIDALSQSLDSYSSVAIPELAAVNSSHVVGLFRGANLEATLYTAEQADQDEGRIYVNGMRPITDAPTVFGSVYGRETRMGVAVQSAETAVNAIGVCPQRVSTRYARGKARVPAGTSWTFATGIEAEIMPDGKR
jgi:hypothetical protein